EGARRVAGGDRRPERQGDGLAGAGEVRGGEREAVHLRVVEPGYVHPGALPGHGHTADSIPVPRHRLAPGYGRRQGGGGGAVVGHGAPLGIGHLALTPVAWGGGAGPAYAVSRGCAHGTGPPGVSQCGAAARRGAPGRRSGAAGPLVRRGGTSASSPHHGGPSTLPPASPSCRRYRPAGPRRAYPGGCHVSGRDDTVVGALVP